MFDKRHSGNRALLSSLCPVWQKKWKIAFTISDVTGHRLLSSSWVWMWHKRVHLIVLSSSLFSHQENRSWRKERFYQVPLCWTDCDAWFSDCVDDFTCTDNWSLNFVWQNTTEGCQNGAPACLKNYCPPQSACKTFKEIYQTAENFCEKVIWMVVYFLLLLNIITTVLYNEKDVDLI